MLRFLPIGLLLLPLMLGAAPVQANVQANVQAKAQAKTQARAQPASVPPKYAYAGVSVTVVATGKQGAAVFYPLGVPPQRQLPLILFMHGWGAVNPQVYGGWISHLARQGNVVVFPYYQGSPKTPPAEITANAQEGVRSALSWLQGPQAPVGVNAAKTAVVGHSMGALAGVNYAALAQAHGLPVPRVVLAVQPGKTWGKDTKRNVPLADLNTLEPRTLLVAMVGEDDRLVGDVDARKIYSNAGGVPKSRKAVVQMMSDARAKPALRADHAAPAAAAPSRALDKVMAAGQGAQTGGGGTEGAKLENTLLQPTAADALDTEGLWKTFDLLRQAAAKGQTLRELGKNPQWLSLARPGEKRPPRPLKILLP